MFFQSRFVSHKVTRLVTVYYILLLLFTLSFSFFLLFHLQVSFALVSLSMGKSYTAQRKCHIFGQQVMLYGDCYKSIYSLHIGISVRKKEKNFLSLSPFLSFASSNFGSFPHWITVAIEADLINQRSFTLSFMYLWTSGSIVKRE